MSPQPSALRTVIVAAVEPSAASDEVVRTAASMCRITPGAELHFVHIVNPGPPPHELALSMTDLVAEGRAYLDGLIARVASELATSTSGHLAAGEPAERILQIASDIGADIIVVGTHRKRGLARILGSVSERVLRHATCPVLLARVKPAPAASEIAIEPPCPECVATQRSSGGATLWCPRHAERHLHGRLHYSASPIFAAGSMFVR